MTSSPAWMPLYVADYLADTGHLSAAEHGAYMLLIMHYWRQRELPSDDRALARIARMSEQEWDGSRGVLAELFDPNWKHGRVESELAKADRKSEARATAGSNGGTAKAVREASKRVANASELPGKPQANGVASSSHTQDTSLRSVSEARAAPKRATRLEPDWKPSEADRRFAREKGFSESDIDLQTTKIVNWSRTSKNGAKLEWPRVWQNWILGAMPSARAGPFNGQPKRNPSIVYLEKQRENYDPGADEPYVAKGISGFG
jgi:uncharacterized protein YdaU (DUF1376 family)